MNSRIFVDYTEAASILQVSIMKIRRLCNSGNLLSIKRKGKWYIYYDSIMEYMRIPRKKEASIDIRPKRENYIRYLPVKMNRAFLLNTYQAAKILNISISQVKRLCHSGMISACKINNKWVMHRESVRSYIDQHKKKKQTESCAKPKSKTETYIDLFIYGMI